MKKNLKEIIALVLTITTLSALTVFAERVTNQIESTAENDAVIQNSTTYTGEEITPNLALQDAGKVLVNGTDYDLTYENNINVGTATIVVTFKGNYQGTRRVNFDIVVRELSSSDVTFTTIDNQTYTGSEITPEPVITYGGITLVKDKDYTLTYDNNINAGTATVNVTFIGNFSGTATTSFEIVPDRLSTEDVSFTAIDNQTYTGQEITPEPIITYHDVTLVKDKDYTLTYDNNINAGTAAINVTFIGNYAGEASTSFVITAKVVTESNITISPIPDQTYTGSEIKPEPTVTDISQ